MLVDKVVNMLWETETIRRSGFRPSACAKRLLASGTVGH